MAEPKRSARRLIGEGERRGLSFLGEESAGEEQRKEKRSVLSELIVQSPWVIHSSS